VQEYVEEYGVHLYMNVFWKCIHAIGLLAITCAAKQQSCNTLGVAEKNTYSVHNATNQCVTFNVGAGTGCAWMCEYCANALGTSNYYFTDGVCAYQYPEGCTGSPVAGVEYTCCSGDGASRPHQS